MSHAKKTLTFNIALSLKDHARDICKNARGKVSVLARLAAFLTEYKKKTFDEAFFESLFSYLVRLSGCSVAEP